LKGNAPEKAAFLHSTFGANRRRMKICKAIKVCRKLAKAALPDAAPGHRGALRTAKALLDRFDEELAARSEATSITQAALAIAAAGRARRESARELEFLAEVAARHLTVRAVGAKKDETSAVAIVRTLASSIRSAATRSADRASHPRAGSSLHLA
jgi:hypothetical protein